MLLTTVEQIDDIVFAHPKDMQEGQVAVRPGDVIANLPYHPNCALWFDHHVSEAPVAAALPGFKGKFGEAPNAARLVYEYYDDPRLAKYESFLQAVNKSDAARLTAEDVTDPKGWVLVSYTIDPRTGLGAFREYFLDMVQWIKERTLEEILELPEVKRRCPLVLEEQEQFKKVLLAHSRQDGNVVITDFRGLRDVPAGNRFLVYTLFPEANVSVRLFDGKGGEFVVAALGHSIFNRTCQTDLGKLLVRYGGGGHTGAGTVQVSQSEAEPTFREIVEALKRAG